MQKERNHDELVGLFLEWGEGVFAGEKRLPLLEMILHDEKEQEGELPPYPLAQDWVLLVIVNVLDDPGDWEEQGPQLPLMSGVDFSLIVQFSVARMHETHRLQVKRIDRTHTRR